MAATKQYGIQITYLNLTDKTQCVSPIMTPMDTATSENIAAFMATTPNPSLLLTVKGVEIKLEVEV